MLLVRQTPGLVVAMVIEKKVENGKWPTDKSEYENLLKEFEDPRFGVPICNLTITKQSPNSHMLEFSFYKNENTCGRPFLAELKKSKGTEECYTIIDYTSMGQVFVEGNEYMMDTVISTNAHQPICKKETNAGAKNI